MSDPISTRASSAPAILVEPKQREKARENFLPIYPA
jgi:hypothetical protein